MGEIINLRKVRKARARVADANEAAANRARHGSTLEQRERERLEADQARRHLDGAYVSADAKDPSSPQG